ncbi:DUF4911 domain-containing protein [Desulfococcus sp.]|uniref:DUF4911 domain-containing protein n=1 Tax=Desulfococcus sp. TaxID=2025834 RepID=UPI0035939DE0
METIKKFFRVDRREIAFLKFVLEACDGIATMRTIDGPSETVLLSISPGCEHEVDSVLRGLGKEILMERVAPEARFVRRSHEY